MNQYKKLTGNVLAMTIGQFSSKILSFLLVPMYTYILSTEEFGTFDLLITTVTLLTPLLTLTVSEAVMRFCLEEKYSKKEILTIGIVFSAVGTAVLAAGYPIIIRITAIADYYIWLVVFFAVSNFYTVLTQYLKGVNQVKLYSVCGIISTALTLVLNILFLCVFKWQIFGYMLAYVLSHLLIVVLICSKIKIHKCVISPFKIKKSTIKEVLAYSCPMIPNSICWWVSNSSDKYMVRGMVSVAALGVYSVSYKIPNLMVIFSTIFNSAFQISAVENFGDESSKKFFGNTYKFFSSCNAIVAAELIFASKYIAVFLYQKDFFDAWKASAVLVLAFFFNALAAMVGAVYTSSKKTKMLFYSTLIAAVVNIVFNVILIKPWGIIGAAAATCLSYFVVLVIRLIHSRKIFKFPINHTLNITTYIILTIQVVCAISDTTAGAVLSGVLMLIVVFINGWSLLKGGMLDLLKQKFLKR